MIKARILYFQDPKLFQKAAKGKNFEQFILQLQKDKETTMVYMDMAEKKKLFKLAKNEV